ncbi:MAG: hypothetical protein H7Y22_11160 [Gemmatimonadaceae bacterium]|nr:hypothetical protein [Gloeobacterales cyanobacterium ES-bin-141]
MRPAIDPLSFPDAAFIGDVLVVDVRGRHLDGVDKITIKPARGVTAAIGDPLNKRNGRVEVGPERLTLTIQISFDAAPGDRRFWVESAEGESNQLLITVMM